MPSSYTGKYASRDANGTITHVQCEDPFGNGIPLDLAEYRRRGIKPDAETLPAAPPAPTAVTPPDAGRPVLRKTEIPPDVLEQLHEESRLEMQHWQGAPARFFDAWKEGARLAGYQYFGDGTKEGLNRASDKNQLRPDYPLISSAIGVISSGERVFISTLYSFYNSEDGGELMRRCDIAGMADVVSNLDLPRRQVLAALMLSYTGW